MVGFVKRHLIGLAMLGMSLVIAIGGFLFIQQLLRHMMTRSGRFMSCQRQLRAI